MVSYAARDLQCPGPQPPTLGGSGGGRVVTLAPTRLMVQGGKDMGWPQEHSMAL